LRKGTPDYIRAAIKCGRVPQDLEGWKTKPLDRLSDGEKVLRFAQDFLVFPEGAKIGQPLVLDPFQCAFILAAFDSDVHVSKAILSMARRGGKTLLMAVILLAFIVGPLAKENTLIRSAATTREQAGLLHRLMALTLQMSRKLDGLYRIVPSSKKISGLRRNTEYQSLSRDAKSGHGLAIYVLVVDECGQIDAANDEFLDMLFSSLGSFKDSRSFLISTQAPNDASFFSVEIDTAERDRPENVVCHVYSAASEDIFDEANWYAANPSLYGGYRSIEDIRRNAEEASRIPAKQNGFLNLFMNRRVALESAWLAPSVWKENSGAVGHELFRSKPVVMGLDLSMVNDLSAAVIAADDDDGNVHLRCFAFTPLDGVEERERRDRIPLQQWVRDGFIYAPPGKSLDYDMIATYLRDRFEDEEIEVGQIQFDRYRARDFFGACDRVGAFPFAQRVEVGQGFVSMGPRLEAFETGLLRGRIRHGSNPILNMGAAAAIVVRDDANNRKLTRKNRNTGPKIDGLVSAVMAAYPLLTISDDSLQGDVSWMVA
jgi:phage terminase large subunit-like protein